MFDKRPCHYLTLTKIGYENVPVVDFSCSLRKQVPTEDVDYEETWQSQNHVERLLDVAIDEWRDDWTQLGGIHLE